MKKYIKNGLLIVVSVLLLFIAFYITKQALWITWSEQNGDNPYAAGWHSSVGVHSYTGDSLKAQMSITSPKGGDALCKGQIFPVSWKVPADVKAINLIIRPVNDNMHLFSLGAFPPSYDASKPGNNNGEGSYGWTVGTNNDNLTMPDSPAYELILQATSKDDVFAAQVTDPFTIVSKTASTVCNPQKSASASETLVVTQNGDYPGWMRATDSKYRFSFSYPKEYKFIPPDSGSAPGDVGYLRSSEGTELDYFVEDGAVDRNLHDPVVGDLTVDQTSPIKIGNKQGYYWTTGDAGCGGPLAVVALNNSQTIRFKMVVCDSWPDTDLFKKILGTVVF